MTALPKLLATALLFLFITSFVSFAQSYAVNQIIGGEGDIGQKIKYTGYKHALGANSIFFVSEVSERRLFEIDGNGIIIKKYDFDFISRLSSTKDFWEINSVAIDSKNRFYILSEENRMVYCINNQLEIQFTINLSGKLLPYFSTRLVLDTNDNLYLNGNEQIYVFDGSGKELEPIGKKGTENGQFSSGILKIQFDANNKMFVLERGKIQIFDETRKYLKTITIDKNIEAFTIDPAGYIFYGLDEELIKSDLDGKFKANYLLGDRFIDQLDFFKGNLLVFFGYFGIETIGYNFFDTNGKFIKRIHDDRRVGNNIWRLNFIQFDKLGRLWIFADGEFLIMEKNGTYSKLPDSFYSTFEDAGNIFDIKSGENIVYYNFDVRQIKSKNIKTGLEKAIYNVPKDYNVRFFQIDSTNNEMIVMEGLTFSKSILKTLNFDGTLKKKIFEADEIEAVTRDNSGNFIVANQESYNELKISIITKNGDLLNSFSPKIWEFANSVNGIYVDKSDIIHIGIRNVYGLDGFSIYAFNKNGTAKGVLKNLGTNQGNFGGGDSYAIDSDGEFLYYADPIDSKILKLKYNADINAKAIATITISDVMKTLGDTDFSLNPISDSKSPFVYNITSGQSVSVSASGLVKILKAGSTNIKISQIENQEYEATSKTIIITVEAISAIINPISLITKLVSDSDFKLSPVSNSTGIFTYKIISGDAVSVDNLGTVKIIKAGSAVIQINQAAKDSFGSTSLNVEILVNKLSQSITFEVLPSKILTTNAGLKLVAKSSSGLPITFKLISGPATLSGDVLKPTGTIGKIIVEASQSGNEKYALASNIRQEIEVAAPVLADELVEKENLITVFPNPANDVINIKINNYKELKIIDTFGRIINEIKIKGMSQIIVSNLQNGVYYLVFSGKNSKNHIEKFIISR